MTKMKKPEKKYGLIRKDRRQFCQGYNSACDDFEKFLPSEAEILTRILVTTQHRGTLLEPKDRQIAKAIHQMIRGG